VLHKLCITARSSREHRTESVMGYAGSAEVSSTVSDPKQLSFFVHISSFWCEVLHGHHAVAAGRGREGANKSIRPGQHCAGGGIWRGKNMEYGWVEQVSSAQRLPDANHVFPGEPHCRGS